MAAREFSLEAVRDFINSHGGRITNHELVTRFKSFLNDPHYKDENREKFKGYVNTLATIKVDERGEKFLLLKKKYRGDSSHQDSSRAWSEPPSKSAPVTPDNIDGSGMSKGRSESSLDRTADNTSSSSSMRDSVSFGTLSTSSVTSTTSQNSQTSQNSKSSMEEEGDMSVISVKERALHLNKIQSESDLLVPKPSSHVQMRNKQAKDGEGEDDSHSSGTAYTPLEPEERQWMVTCSFSEYHPMHQMLSKNPALAKKRDFTNGYTALHWAAKHGKPEVIKMLAGYPGVNMDQRSYGGYTPLHLAAIQGHEDIIELLVKAYKADANIRDYSGKKAKQYLRNSASTQAQQLLLSNRLATSAVAGKNFLLDDTFTRSASFRKSNRTRAISSLIQGTTGRLQQAMLRKTWGGSSEDILRDRKSPSPHTTPSPERKSTMSFGDRDLMPPPVAPARRTKKSGDSSSKESLSDLGQLRGSVQRSESEPSLGNLQNQSKKQTYI